MALISRPSEPFLGGRIQLRQPEKGHRAGTDAVLLAACAPGRPARAADVGAGVGAAGLSALARAPKLDMTCIEIDPALSELCERNIAENFFGERARAVQADVLTAASRRAAGLEDGGFDLVLTNPPFLDARSARVSPDAAKALAHVAKGGLEPWMKASVALLRPGGFFAMIHRADALGEIIAASAKRTGKLRIMPVHAKAAEPAVRLLVSGVKGSRAPLSLLPPLVLHEADGQFTPEARAIHRGEAGIDLFGLR